MLTLLLILPLPLLATVAFFIFSNRVCWREFGVTLAAVVVIGLVSMLSAYYGATRDQEILNGTVVGKEKNRVSCSHSYQCNCRMVETCSGSGASRSCHQTQRCSTCYEHSNDWDWDVETTVGDLTIDRIDRQGVKEPPRWTAVRAGEPASREHTFINYIKAAPDSVLRMTGQEKDFQGLLPSYPGVYDYYRAQHLIPVGVQVPDLEKHERTLNVINGALGSMKQVNILFVIVKTGDRRYLHALEEHWLGGKKNDLVVILGVPDGQDKITWAGVMTWSNVETLKVLLRDDIEKLGTINRMDEILEHTRGLVAKHFSRKPMKDFAYLQYQYTPSTGTMMFFTLFALFASVGLGIYFIKNDPFESGFTGYKRGRTRAYNPMLRRY